MLAIGVLFSVTSLRAQDNNIGPFVSTVGTTWREAGNNQDWAYLFWIGNEISHVGGRSYAIYAKSGDANSPAAYSRVAIVSMQADARVIQPLLARGASIGDNTNNLHVDIDALFGKFVAPTLPLAEKVSAVLRGAMADENQLGRLLILARTHPSFAMALGIGHAEPIGPGLTTFEVREFDRTAQQDIAVIGRVTVEAGVPTQMPAPGAPVAVPSFFARGNMNIALRWPTPDGLRRLSMLQHGFNVWRVMKHYAEAPSRNWHLSPPTTAQLLSSYSSTAAVWRLNRLPLIPSKQFTPADVANFIADSNTVFTIDDNDVGRPGVIDPPPGWTNGARFYYFVTARDLLGRDGAVSPGTQIMVCDQLGPNALTSVTVENDYNFNGGTPHHHLRVVWKQPTNSPDETIVRYWLYRWTNANEVLHQSSNGPLYKRIAVVNHNPLLAKNSYLDDGPGSPAAPANYSRTYWYTIRAEDGGACGGNLSPHSAPVPGTLRDRIGPPPPRGGITNTCLRPLITVTSNGIAPGAPEDNAFTLNVVGARTTPRISWMEFTLEARQGPTNVVVWSNISPRRYFAPNDADMIWNVLLPGNYQSHVVRLIARAGTGDGDISNLGASPFVDVSKIQENDDKFFRFLAAATMIPERRDPCPDRHEPSNPDGSINPVDIGVQPAPGTRELRFYRRVNDGPLTLICQFEVVNPNQFYNCSDDSFPSPGAEICWYVQAFDEHGNPSPLVKLGCNTILSLGGPPKPMLSPIQPTGDDNSPGMTLRWFCPPAGVKRFEVQIAGVPEQLPDNPSPLNLLIAPPNEPLQLHPVPKTIKVMDIPLLNFVYFKKFLTPAIGNGSSFGNGAEFTVPVSIKTGVRYYAMVKAVGIGNIAGESSNIETFRWKPPPTNPVPTVPWPARPLPNVGNSFNFNFAAFYTNNPHNAFTGACVLIGHDPTAPRGTLDQPQQRPQKLDTSLDFVSYLPKNTNDAPLFPIVLYRHQVPNATYPTVSGDITQASPMMEEIAYQRVNTNGVQHINRDPFIIFDSPPTGTTALPGITTYLIDTSPVMRGARYKYLLVRFAENGEIAEVIPTNDVEVP